MGMKYIDLNEIYILNLVLDKGDIFAIPSLSSKKLPALLVEKVYNSLIKKQILINSNTFTEEGAKLVKCIADYKQAERYVKIKTVIIGIYKEGYGIALLENPFIHTYAFVRIKEDFSKMKFEELQKGECTNGE